MPSWHTVGITNFSEQQAPASLLSLISFQGQLGMRLARGMGKKVSRKDLPTRARWLGKKTEKCGCAVEGNRSQSGKERPGRSLEDLDDRSMSPCPTHSLVLTSSISWYKKTAFLLHTMLVCKPGNWTTQFCKVPQDSPNCGFAALPGVLPKV